MAIYDHRFFYVISVNEISKKVGKILDNKYGHHWQCGGGWELEAPHWTKTEGFSYGLNVTFLPCGTLMLKK